MFGPHESRPSDYAEHKASPLTEITAGTNHYETKLNLTFQANISVSHDCQKIN